MASRLSCGRRAWRRDSARHRTRSRGVSMGSFTYVCKYPGCMQCQVCGRELSTKCFKVVASNHSVGRVAMLKCFGRSPVTEGLISAARVCYNDMSNAAFDGDCAFVAKSAEVRTFIHYSKSWHSVRSALAATASLTRLVVCSKRVKSIRRLCGERQCNKGYVQRLKRSSVIVTLWFMSHA